MDNVNMPPQYLQIALDIANRVAKGELQEGQRIYGRSLMASEYKVSPETIRRALRLLADMKVVEIKPQSGTVVLSVDSARRYISNFGEELNTLDLRAQLRELMEQYAELNTRLRDTVMAVIKNRYTTAAAENTLPNYEVPVPKGSAIIGKSIGALKFWQSTGSTIVAIRRGWATILSPGPYAELYEGDVIVIVGTPAAAEAAKSFVCEKEAKCGDDTIQ